VGMPCLVVLLFGGNPRIKTLFYGCPGHMLLIFFYWYEL
jgi:hypothetical protein